MQTTFADIVRYLLSLINQVIFVLIGLAVVLFLWGVVNYIRKATSTKQKDAQKYMLWSLLTLFVLVSIWGILAVMCATLSLCSQGVGAPLDITPGAYTF